MTLDSAELYDLDIKCVPDVLGLRARRTDAPVVMSGSDSQCVVILDENVGY